MTSAELTAALVEAERILRYVGYTRAADKVAPIARTTTFHKRELETILSWFHKDGVADQYISHMNDGCTATPEEEDELRERLEILFDKIDKFTDETSS